MTSRRTPIFVHLLGAAAASALAAYWVLRLLAPASPIVPPAAPVATMREPDAGLAARMFGDVNTGPAPQALNVQVTGVFAAANDSSAVIAVDGKAPRAVLLGRDVVAGLRLVEVRPDGVTLEHEGVRTRYPVPPLSIAKSSSPSAMFRREGDTLTAPSMDPAAAGKAPTAARPLATSTPIAGQPLPAASPATLAPAVPPPTAPDEASRPARMIQPPPNAPSVPAPPLVPANAPGGG